MKILADLFHTSWVRALFGIALCASLIGFGGPYLGLGDTQPLASVTSRFVAIAVVAALWIGVLMGRRWLAARRSERLGAELSSQPDGERADSDARARAERDALRHRFAEAMAVLRKRRDGGGDLRELPWYLLIGAPGSGKSTLLEHSGFEFPLLGGMGQRSLGGVGGTRDCDWWFTDRAVFLDTAGRYTTQDSDPHADASAWTGFLGLLRRHRRRRPVNGILLTMSVADVLTMTDAERQQHAQRLRERLDEIGTRLGVAVPVYMVFTKCDLVAGFMEFFDALDPAGRAQVWGTTFTAGQSVQGGAPALLGAEFDALLERIDERVIERMHAERDVRRRARILSFPQQLRAFREAALPLVSTVFGSHAYGRPPLLRGVYLTSGTQEGTPIDRVLSVVGRSFGMHATAPASTRAQRRTYFTERLLKETILPEAGFVGADPVAWRRRRLAEAAAIGGIGVLAVALVVGMTTSFGRNADYVARVDQALHDFPVDDPGARPASLRQYYAQALQRLDLLARAEQVAGQVRDRTPWSMRFGLFQGDAIFDEVRGAREREFQASVVPGLALQFRDDLRGLAGDPQRLYYVLKGYLMLGDTSHRDRDQLVLLAGERWREVFPDEDSLVQALEGHFRILFDGSDKMRALPLDNSLIDAARATLRAANLATLIYGGVKIDSASRRDAPVRLDRVLGLRGDVFRRRSGAPLSRPLPALFTRPVFAAMVQEAPPASGSGAGGISSAVDRFVDDGWVLGATTADPLRRVSLVGQVRALYVADYIRAWDGLLGDLELQPVSNVQEASGVAARLAAPGSPLKALLALVRDNTAHLLRTASTDGADDGADAPIVEHFAALNQLTDGAVGATPLDHTLGTLDQLSKTLLGMNPAADAIGRPDPTLAAARLEAAQLPPPLSGWMGSLVGSSQSLVSKGASGALADGFREAAGADCTRFVQGRYPFAATRGNDIPLQDFAALFGNGGRFDTFFRQTLSRVVDSAGPTWTFRDADSAKTGAGVLAEAQLADTIRQVYFRDGPQPQVGFTVSMTTPPAGIDRLTIEVDGQTYEYKAGQAPVSVAMQWPGPKPGLTRISAWDTSGNPLPVLEYPGDWGLFHALDAASLQRRTETRFGASFGFGATHANVDIEAASLRNPFSDNSVRRFRCPA
ncbi:type VI secretion system membrane subunit TssM [Luteibacter sp. E-22]|uniref:type VI secretion system membrane subunit TssM n=1 Tax=Luteibacter sp. E-22 TaxID=3404050 RepID=UPI003CF3896F